MESVIVGVDFDGTVVESAYPGIGHAVPGAIPTLKELVDNGHRLVLWTLRDGNDEYEALQFLHERGVTFWASNENPEQRAWSESRKAHCHIYIDDKALGCPLVCPSDGREPYVNWYKVRQLLRERGLIK